MALFDVAGKAAGVPVYRLLGKKVRDWCPISWWAIDMSPEDFALEAKDAVAQGYTSFKQKARPWFDVFEQAKQTSAVIPQNFKLDYDFNGQLGTAATAVPVLKELDKFPNMAIYESPIPQGDVEGNRRIRQNTRCAIAMHYGSPPILTAVREEVCDGFVIGGGAASVMRQAHLSQEANMPFWLQLVGTAWTTTMALHLGAVCTHAQWPAVTCLNMYVDQLATQPVQIKGGYARVPETPGLGIEFNEASLRWKTDSSTKPNADALYAAVRDNGDKTWYASEYGEHGFWNDFLRGNQPLFEQGVRLETWLNDGSKEWQELAARTQESPVRCHA
jgi:L-alanine-DL-glutamate epimerase-like enolase superfamily enzyme